MEKRTPIRQKDTGIMEGVFITLECMICGDTHVVAECNKKELVESIANEGWSTLDSDRFGMIGYYCGCRIPKTNEF